MTVVIRWDATGTDLTLVDSDGIVLGALTLSGKLTVSAGGNVSDSDGKAITVAGLTSIEASTDFDIVLDNVGASRFR